MIDLGPEGGGGGGLLVAQCAPEELVTRSTPTARALRELIDSRAKDGPPAFAPEPEAADAAE